MTDSVLSNMDGIRAPRANNVAAISPERNSLARVLQDNRNLWNSIDVPAWIRELRHSARRELLDVLREYSQSYLADATDSEIEVSTDRGWIVGGHQPELFHPGVWFKNFLMDRVARETSSISLNAIVDHDLARATSLRVPARDVERHVAHACMIPLPLMRPSTPDLFLPWNAWRVDRTKIALTCDEIEKALRSVGLKRSMVSDFLHQLGEISEGSDAALALSKVRHAMERRHEVGNWEFPVSRLCQIDAWRLFVSYCIAHADELNQTYNACLEAYRARESISNPTQPVPRLGRQGKWIELPFWLRLPGDFARHRMWVGQEGTRCVIATQGDGQGAVSQWNDRGGAGSWIVWPRALMTTLFLRVFIADLFVHGIGGGLYDRLTDTMIEQFLKLTPPQFVTCTATLWLDFPQSDPESTSRIQEQGAHLERERQRLRSAPEHYLDLGQREHMQLWDEHRQLLDQIPPRGQKRNWHTAVTLLKKRMAAAIDPSRRDWDHRKAEWDTALQNQRLMQSREFSYVLFEEQNIFERLRNLAQCPA